jgi:hypothetical protein
LEILGRIRPRKISPRSQVDTNRGLQSQGNISHCCPSPPLNGISLELPEMARCCGFSHIGFTRHGNKALRNLENGAPE